jgi:hypothetical protein
MVPVSTAPGRGAWRLQERLDDRDRWHHASPLFLDVSRRRAGARGPPSDPDLRDALLRFSTDTGASLVIAPGLLLVSFIAVLLVIDLGPGGRLGGYDFDPATRRRSTVS